MIATYGPGRCQTFDRLLFAQASVEGIWLLTADALLATYPGPVKLV